MRLDKKCDTRGAASDVLNNKNSLHGLILGTLHNKLGLTPVHNNSTAKTTHIQNTVDQP